MQFDLSSTYASVVKEIFSLSKGNDLTPSLFNIERLCEYFKHPERSFQTVHVAGTNGKGSVCTKIASALAESRYVTGLYTSPHLYALEERIQIGGVPIAQEEIVTLYREVQAAIKQLRMVPTFFEITTIIAFLYFKKKGVDIAVIETGIGGRWDATNVVMPLVSVITSIGYDHTELLGSSLLQIAQEKAGIIKKNVPVILGPDVPLAPMQARADRLGSPLVQNTLRHADYDAENQDTARLALQQLMPWFSLSSSAIEKGLLAKPPCRFERHVLSKPLVVDVAHNVHGFERLIQLLLHTFPHLPLRFIVSFSKSKDIASVARLISQYDITVHLVEVSHPRLALPASYGHLFPNSLCSPSIANALEIALHDPKEEAIVIAGSFFIMSEVREALLRYNRDRGN